MQKQSHFLKQVLWVNALFSVFALVWVSSAAASRLPGNRIVFDQSPELIEASVVTTDSGQKTQIELIIELPLGAGEPLEALMIQLRDDQRPNAQGYRATGLTFNPNDVVAYSLKADGQDAMLPLASVGGGAISPSTALVVFAEAVEPGNQVMVVLPNDGSFTHPSFEVGVTAYPAGDSPVGQFLGYRPLGL